MIAASRDDILGCVEKRFAYLSVKLNGNAVRVQSLTSKEQELVDAKRFLDYDKIDRTYVFADLAMAAIVNDQGDLIFGEVDREQLASIDGGLARLIHDGIRKHLRSGPYEATDEELKKSSIAA